MAMKVTMWKAKDGRIFHSEKEAVAADAEENLRLTLDVIIGHHNMNDMDIDVNVDDVVNIIILNKNEIRIVLNDEYQESLSFREE